MSDMKTKRPVDILNNAPMQWRQWLVVVFCIFAMALDGYDVMSIALAGAGMTAEWGLSKAQLGFLLPLEFLGMAIGSIFLGALTDLYGRRLSFLLCLVIVTIGMAISGYAPNMEILAVSRVITGVGVGGILTSATALGSEYSNARNRSLIVILIAGGYTFGIYLASKFAAPILLDYDWRVIFKLGALISLLFIPVVLLLVPESIGFLERRRPAGFEARIRKNLHQMGHDEPFQISEEVAEEEHVSVKRLFDDKTRRITIIMMIFYLGNILTYYYFVKWMPPAVTDLGYTPVEGTEVLAMISIGGLVGSVAMAAASRLFALKPLMIISLFGSGLSVAAFPFFTETLDSMLIAGTIAGFWLFAVIGGAFGLFAESFPPAVLASGTGLVLGAGRGGAVVGPWAGGLLFAAGMGLMSVSPIMAAGSLLAGVAVIFLPRSK